MFEKLLPFEVAQYILGKCNKYQQTFKAINKRAELRFEHRDWQGIQADMKERLTLYREFVGDSKVKLAAKVGDKLKDPDLWRGVKTMYEEQVINLYYRDIAETFYNSVFRHVHKGLSVDKELMFVMPTLDKMDYRSARPIFRTYQNTYESAKGLVTQLFKDYKLDAPYEDLERDIDLITHKIETELFSKYTLDETSRLEVLKPIFYRNKAAYIVGRAHLGGQIHPFIIPLLHEERGVYADALLLEYNHIASIFTYYRAHFLVDVDIPSEMVVFLKSILPHKPISELYTCMGFEKHGKTEMYRSFLSHLEQHNDEKFDFAPGIKGMVMSVFTLPSYNMVFKIIKDKFAPPKNVSEKEVIKKYELVTQHDRVGRLADTHLFENFVCEKDRFSPELLKELRSVAKTKVILRGEKVEIKHLYVEKKMIPLNLYLDKATPEEAHHILNDYGRALKQLAAANIFPGDLLLKNFGVTRLKRVVFYDYDEIELVTDCQFRKIPTARNHDDEMSSDSWFYVGVRDVFPEEFPPFLFPQKELRAIFESLHPDILTPQYWNDVKTQLQNGKIIDVFPYPEELRFGQDGWRSA
jgi:isocitrate dehydrogenase kinase/phosphatase